MNESRFDRIIRIVLGIVFVVAAIGTHGGWSILLYVLGIIALLTGLTGFCLVYRLFGINTRKKGA